MAPLSLFAAAAALYTVSALQIPFLPSQIKQNPIVADLTATKKAPIDTEALQALINPDNLLKRAKELYEIAKLGEEEYGHPTRVIGSDGMYSHLLGVCRHQTEQC